MSRERTHFIVPSAGAAATTQEALCVEYRHRLKAQLRAGRFETLSEALLRLIARFATTVCFKKIQFGYGSAAALLFLLTFSVTTLLALWSDSTAWREIGVLHFWGALVAILQLLSARYYARRICRTLADDVIDQMTRLKDLQDLSQWLKTTFHKGHQLRFCLVLAKVLTLVSIAAAFALERTNFINSGTILLETLGWFQGAMGWYFLIPGATLTKHLARHEYALFTPDPASSRLVVALSNMLYSSLFVAVAIATLFSSGVFSLGQQNPRAQIAFLVLSAWGPILLIIVLHQLAAMKIVERAKRRALAPIQAAVIELQARLNSLDSAELERLNKLLDLHKRILDSNALAMDWKGMLVIVNTLLLPAVSLLVQLFRSSGDK